MIVKINSCNELAFFAKNFLEKLIPYKKGATVVALIGGFGVGKTTFTQCIARELSVTEVVTSPTFVIMKKYTLVHKIFSHLIHIDAYRLDSYINLDLFSFDSVMSDTRNIVLIEWPKNIQKYLPHTHTIVTFHLLSENKREIEVQKIE